jgi:DDE superfamily endonuclease
VQHTDSVCACPVLTVTVAFTLCEEIATLRRRLQRMPKRRVLFLDEVAVRVSEAATCTIVLPGEQPFVVATDTSSYAKRFDMIACCSGEQVFIPSIYSPSERSTADVKGINTEMLIDYVLSTLGQETAALDDPPLLLVLDRARIHNTEQVLEAFSERGGHVTEIVKMPSNAAKRMSPLDNALFHDWKEAIRKRAPLTVQNIAQIMSDEWNNLSTDKIKAHYQHCGITRRCDPYADCPAPSVHAH